MQIVTAEVMRELDRRAMAEGGIPGAVLMENAGRAVFEGVAERFGPVAGRAFAVCCGTGNNGGDGFVVARYLRLAGARVSVHVAGEFERIQGDARSQLDVLRAVGVEPRLEPPSPAAAVAVVDALLGTGSTGAPRGHIADAIRAVNAAGRPVVAVDTPSGVDADTGATIGVAVRAELTVTFAFPKLGLFLPPGADLVGELRVADIGFDWTSLGATGPYRWLRAVDMRPLLTPRPRNANKGMFGHLLVIGGSRGMSGAPTMAAKAALRTGVGLITIGAPSSAQTLIAPRVDEAMTVALPERDGALAEEALDAVREAFDRCDAVALGPGATRLPGAEAFIVHAVRELDKPLVLDADGLNALAAHPDALNGRTAPTVLTPHPGECGRLLGTDARSIETDRVGAVRSAAQKYGAVVVLKGARTLICDGRSRSASGGDLPVSVNTTGNPGMATGGSGDTLTGIIGALVAAGRDPYDAACLGVFLHGVAGDIAATRSGEQGMVAGDIAAAMPSAIRDLESGLCGS